VLSLGLATSHAEVLTNEQTNPDKAKPEAKQTANIAVLAIRGAAKTPHMWRPTAK